MKIDAIGKKNLVKDELIGDHMLCNTMGVIPGDAVVVVLSDPSVVVSETVVAVGDVVGDAVGDVVGDVVVVAEGNDVDDVVDCVVVDNNVDDAVRVVDDIVVESVLDVDDGMSVVDDTAIKTMRKYSQFTMDHHYGIGSIRVIINSNNSSCFLYTF